VNAALIALLLAEMEDSLAQADLPATTDGKWKPPQRQELAKQLCLNLARVENYTRIFWVNIKLVNVPTHNG
jgi:hypothetical protein